MAIDIQACSSFAKTFSRLLARAVSDACEIDWQIEPVDPQPELLRSPSSPVTYCLQFSEALQGACYIVFEQTALPAFARKGASDGSSEESSAALLEPLNEVAIALREQMGSANSALTIRAELAAGFDGEAAQSVELVASGASGGSALILLHFDEALVACFRTLASGLISASDQVSQANLELVMDVELNVTLRFGQRQLTLREILDLASGSVVELDRQVEEPVELILDGKVIARGEAVIIDGNYGMRVTQVLQPVVY